MNYCQKKKWSMSRLLGQEEKSKDTLLSETLKAEEKKVALVFFYLWPWGQDIGIFPLDDIAYFTSKASKDKMVISRLLGHKSKN